MIRNFAVLPGETRQDLLFDKLEGLMYLVADLMPKSALETRIEETLGTCQVMTVPPANSVTAFFGDLKPLPGRTFRFSRMVKIENMSLWCGFFGTDAISIVPRGAAELQIRRRPDQPAEVTLASGDLSFLSNKLNIRLRISGLRLSVRSEKPVVLTLQKLKNEYSLLIRQGALDVTYTRVPRLQGTLEPVLVQVAPGATLLSDGRLIMDKGNMRLLPGGFEKDESPPLRELPGQAAKKPMHPVLPFAVPAPEPSH